MPCVAEVVNRSLKADCTDFTTKREPVTVCTQFFALSPRGHLLQRVTGDGDAF